MDFSKLLDVVATDLTVANILVNFMVTFVASWVIFIVYKMTYTGVAYSKNFNTSIVLTATVTAMVMMVIGNNLALSLGMVGALSIVRFRAAIKEPKDISFLFWGIAVGLSAGTGAYQIALIGTIFIAIIAFVYKMGMGGETTGFLLIIKGSQLDTEHITKEVNRLTKTKKLRMKNTSDNSSEIIYEVKIAKDSEDQIVKAFSEIDAVTSVNVVAYNGNVAG